MYSINIQTFGIPSIFKIYYLHLHCILFWQPPHFPAALCGSASWEVLSTLPVSTQHLFKKSELFQPGFRPTTWTSWSHPHPLRILQFSSFVYLEANMPEYIFQIILPNVKSMYEHLYKSRFKKGRGSHIMLCCFLLLNVLGLFCYMIIKPLLCF